MSIRKRSVNSQPHSNPGLAAALDATLHRVCADRTFMREMRELGRKSVAAELARVHK